MATTGLMLQFGLGRGFDCVSSVNEDLGRTVTFLKRRRGTARSLFRGLGGVSATISPDSDR